MNDRTSHEIETLTIRIPMRLQRRGGRKLIMTPEGAAMPTLKPRPDETLIKALVRAHRWRRRIESGRAKSITDLAEQEGVTDAYVCRLLPLTCLAPDIVEALFDGAAAQGAEVG
jgi:ParB-like chromosome segregation protein Spo0J